MTITTKSRTAALCLLILMMPFSYTTHAAPKVYEWRLAESWPEDLPIFGGAVDKMMRYAHDLSGGRLKITTHPKEHHGKAFGVLEMVRSQQYEMGHTASYYWKDKDINTLFFTTLPMGMIAPERYAWFYHGGGMELMQQAYQDHKVLAFPGGNTGNQMGGWFNREIRSLDDLKGLRMRIPGLAGEVMKSLGVRTVNLPAGNLLDALESGTLDALEWVGPSLDLDMGFHRTARFYYTGWHEPGTELQFVVNRTAYNKLPADLQKVLQVSMKLAAYDTYIESYHASIENLAVMQQEYPNIQIRAFPTSVMRAIRKETQQQLQQIADDGSPLTREILLSLQTYQKKARLWTRISDQAYLNNTGL